MGEHIAPDVGNDAFSQCDDEIVAARGSRRQHQRDRKQHGEIVGDKSGVSRGEAVIYHASNGKRQAERGSSCQSQEEQGTHHQCPIAKHVGRHAT